QLPMMTAHQAAVAGATQRAEQIRARCLRLEVSNESICHHVRRPVHAGSGIKLFNRLAHKKTDTPQQLGAIVHQPRHHLALRNTQVAQSIAHLAHTAGQGSVSALVAVLLYGNIVTKTSSRKRSQSPRALGRGMWSERFASLRLARPSAAVLYVVSKSEDPPWNASSVSGSGNHRSRQAPGRYETGGDRKPCAFNWLNLRFASNATQDL